MSGKRWWFLFWLNLLCGLVNVFFMDSALNFFLGSCNLVVVVILLFGARQHHNKRRQREDW